MTNRPATIPSSADAATATHRGVSLAELSRVARGHDRRGPAASKMKGGR